MLSWEHLQKQQRNTEKTVYINKKKNVIIESFYARHIDLVMLWNICVTNDKIYVPLVVNTSSPFLIHDLSPVF
jgi:hypothetical protein